VLPIAVAILVALFLIQSRGTARVGLLFGPVVLVYFATLATLGVVNIAVHPEILGILNPTGRSRSSTTIRGSRSWRWARCSSR
jgi:KUP system potassium uptake protein